MAAETAAIDEVNAITGAMIWRVVSDDRGSTTAATEAEYSADLKIRTLRELDFRLIDGKNFLIGDCMTVTAFLNYREAWLKNETELAEARPFDKNFGIEPGVDCLEIGGKRWVITRIQQSGLMDDPEDENVYPAKLTFYLREDK